ncbi:DNA alkylation repair protein [Alicyclobacillus tolerans]|uniref:DNA alkylation repair enzyme n=1 Tax=Alicyclobacillus tolerans TaxID=90970 RepID=A0A1M6LUQ0_9BACL|nr:HEAT repeat domain-containing protein [Alicyclobacillus montanus]SHJ74967.1 DNA alkylation repair enzyme [Alicyclobacillus montanus]
MRHVSVEEWKKQFDDALIQRSVRGMIHALQSQSTTHAGTARAQVKRTAIYTIERYFQSELDTLFQIAIELCKSKNSTAEEIGSQLLVPCYHLDPCKVEHVLQDLADSPNWEVREWVADACGSILVTHFENFYPSIHSWAKNESENVRRAVVLALMYAGKSRNPQFSNRILNILELLLSDRSTYVKENLGPFAIGSALIKYYPDEVLAWLRRCVLSNDEQVRWNVAMVFHAAVGAHYALEAKDIIDILLMDERPYVQGAVNKALKNIRKRCPEYFEPFSS